MDNKKVTRNFKLSSLAVDNRSSVMVLLFIIVVAGMVSYNSMPKATFPDLVIPKIYIGTAYPGNSPLDIEKLITRPLEKEINTISDVEKLTSTSNEGFSSVLVEFDYSIDPKYALSKVKDAVDKARSDPDFPKDLPAEPNVFDLNFSEFPVMNINLSGDFSQDQLVDYAEYLEDKIEALPEISKVDIRGTQDKELKINVDPYRMASMDISFRDVENAITGENVTISGGELLVDGYRRSIRVVGDVKTVDEVKEIIVKREKQNIVYLKDIADVRFEYEDPQSYAREFGKPVVMVDVVKRAGSNLLAASDKIKKIIEDAKTNEFPADLNLSITNDQSDWTRSQVDNLENSIISGVILVVLVLLFFLGLRNALFVGIAIPLSMFITFIVLNVMGVTLSMVVLFGLILALGMLVDNGIVVVENIYRLMDEGMPPVQAAKEGVGEVAWPIITSTLTTLAAFIPLAFWPGMMGEFMGYLPITLIIVLGASLFVGLVINPVLTSRYMKVQEDPVNKRKLFTVTGILVAVGVLLLVAGVITLGNLLIILAILGIINTFILTPASSRFQSGFMPRLENKYFNVLTNALDRPLLYFFSTVGVLVLSIILIGVTQPKVLFFPDNMPKYINIFIEKPIGSDIIKTNEVTKKVEQKVNDLLARYKDKNGKNYLVESVIAQVGEGASDQSRGPAMGTTPDKGRIQVNFVEYQYRHGIDTKDVLEDIRRSLKGIPGVRIVVDKNEAGPPTPKPINLEVSGDDYAVLLKQSEKIKSFIDGKHIPGIEELKLDVELGKPELLIRVDRRKARRLNLSTAQIAMSLRTALFGKNISTFKQGEDDYDIVLRFEDKYRYDLNTLINQRITFRNQSNGRISQVPISAVAYPVKRATFNTVKRKNMKRVITIESNVKEGFNPNETVDQIIGEMQNYELPEGYTISFTGEREEQQKQMDFLSKALMIAVFLIFLIMVTQFNSATTPLIIVGSVVLSLIGVFLGLVIFRMDFIVIMTMVGIISLAGVVVNNAIVLIDYTNLLMQRKREDLGLQDNERLPLDAVKEAIREGGKTRLRPVLLTAITTVLGLIPLAVGMNINYFSLLSSFDSRLYFGGDNVIFWGPMSWTVIFGLTFATFLTLVIVPVMYFIKIRMKYRLIKQK